MAAKPMLDDDEEDALSMVMSAPSEEAGEGIESSEEEAAEKPAKADSGRILDEVIAKLGELRGLVASV
jgi:hypothetical protein